MARPKKQQNESADVSGNGSYNRNIAARFAILTQGFLDAMERQGPLHFIREPMVKSGEKGFSAAYQRERKRYEDAINQLKKCSDGGELSILIATMHEAGTRMVAMQIYEHAGPVRERVKQKEKEDIEAAKRALDAGYHEKD